MNSPRPQPSDFFTTRKAVMWRTVALLAAVAVAASFADILGWILSRSAVGLALLHIAAYVIRHWSILLQQEEERRTMPQRTPRTLGFPLRPGRQQQQQKPPAPYWALVTGGASGLGRAVSLAMLEMGYTVVVWDVSGAHLRQLELLWSDAAAAAAARASPAGKLHCVRCDVADPTSVEQHAEELRAMLARSRPTDPSIDAIVLNAGIVNGTPVAESRREAVAKILKVNVEHLFSVSRAFLPGIYAAASSAAADSELHKSIVVVGSIAGYSGAAQLADYTASKAAANIFAESLAAECRAVHPGIVVSLICPNIIDTGMFEGCRPLRFFPMLRTECVAAAVIDAIRFRKQLVVIPWPMHLLYAAKSLLPYFVIYPHIDRLLGASTAMRSFLPRQHV